MKYDYLASVTKDVFNYLTNNAEAKTEATNVLFETDDVFDACEELSARWMYIPEITKADMKKVYISRKEAESNLLGNYFLIARVLYAFGTPAVLSPEYMDTQIRQVVLTEAIIDVLLELGVIESCTYSAVDPY